MDETQPEISFSNNDKGMRGEFASGRGEKGVGRTTIFINVTFLV